MTFPQGKNRFCCLDFLRYMSSFFLICGGQLPHKGLRLGTMLLSHNKLDVDAYGCVRTCSLMEEP